MSGPAVDSSSVAALWDLAPVFISGTALLVSLLSLLFTVSARPRLRMRASEVRRRDEFEGEMLNVFNVGRRSVVIADVGIPSADGGLYFPNGEIGGKAAPTPAKPPLVLEAGGTATFHFAKGSAEYEGARMVNGYSVITVGPKLPWRRDGLKNISLARRAGWD